jgi:hypothetical protein
VKLNRPFRARNSHAARGGPAYVAPRPGPTGVTVDLPGGTSF